MNPDPCPRCNAYRIILQDLEDQKEVMKGLLRRQEQILDIRIRDEEPENRIQGNIGVIQYFEEEVRKFTDFQKAIHKIMDLTHIHSPSPNWWRIHQRWEELALSRKFMRLCQEMRRISLQNEEIITLLVDIQKSIKEMNIPASSSKERRSIDICATPTGGINYAWRSDRQKRREERLILIKDMSNLERIGLEELAESFANLNVVDLKMAKTEDEEIPSQGNPPYRPRGFNIREGDGFHTYETSRRASQRRRKIDTTPYGKALLEPIHPYGLTLNLDDADFKDNPERLIN